MKNIDELIEFVKVSSVKLADGECPGLLLADSMLEACLELKANMEADDGWISVTDMMPNEDEEVLIYAPEPYEGIMVSSGHSQTFGFLTDIGGMQDVKYWRPLPNPPKEKQS